jgi:hypothetical protein
MLSLPTRQAQFDGLRNAGIVWDVVVDRLE